MSYGANANTVQFPAQTIPISGTLLVANGSTVMVSNSIAGGWSHEPIIQPKKYTMADIARIDSKMATIPSWETVKMAEPKKYNTVVIYNLRVVDLEPRTKIDDVGKPRVILTLLENEIECTPNQDMRTAIILKHADKIKEYDPGGKGHIIIDYTKTWTIPQE
jgi:hypothetical protein